MSIEAINHIMKTHISDGIAKLVAMVLADYAAPVTGMCWPKIETLARQCSQSERTVQRKLRYLEETGVLHVIPHHEGGRQKANRYVIHLPGVPRPPRGDRIDLGDAHVTPEGDCETPIKSGPGCPTVTGMGDSVVTPMGDTAVTPRGNPPSESPSRESPQPPEGGALASRRLLRGNGISAPAAPQPPPCQRLGPASMPPEVAGRFERMWSAFPEAGRIDANRAAAERYFAELNPADQDLAVTAAAGYAAHIRRQETRPKALHSWLRQRRFTNLRPAAGQPGAAGAGAPERVFVREGTPAWDAWCDHDRSQGRVPRSPSWSDSARANGWWFPSVLPPVASAA